MKHITKVQELMKILDMKENVFGNHDSSQKMIYHVDNFRAFLEKRYDDVKPVCVEVVPSIKCNFSCPSCTYRQNGSKSEPVTGENGSKGFMSKSTFERIIDGLIDLGTRSVIITGGGEPTLNPLYLDFIRQAKKSFDVGLYTNCSLIENDISSLIGSNLNFVRMSMNAGDADTHRIMYGVEGKFDAVKNNAIAMGKRRIEVYGKNKGPTLGLGFILGPRNSSDEQLENIAKTLIEMYNLSEGGLDYAAIRPEVQYFTQNPDTGVLEIAKQQPNAEMFQDLYERLERIVKEPVKKEGLQILLNKDGFEQLSKPYHDQRNIAAPWSISFDYDGISHSASEANGNPRYSLTDDPVENLVNVWNSARKKDVMAKMASDISDPNHMPIFPNYKLQNMNEKLIEIQRLGQFSKEEIDLFYSKIDLSNPPAHVNFI